MLVQFTSLLDTVIVGNCTVEGVDHYTYLKKIIQLGRSNLDKEVARRIQLGWAAFGRLSINQSSQLIHLRQGSTETGRINMHGPLTT